MKKVLTLLFVLATSAQAFSQKKIEVREGSENIGGGNHPALTVMIYVKDKDRIEKAFKSKMKDYGGKVSMKKEMFADDCSWKAFGPNTFDSYGKIEEVKGEGFQLIVAVDMGGAFMNGSEHKEQTRLFKNMLKEMAVKLSKDEVEDELKDKQKILAGLEGDQKDLEKKKENLKEDIEDYKKKIQKAEEDIKKNEEDQTKKKEEIEGAKKVVKEVEEKMKKIE